MKKLLSLLLAMILCLGVLVACDTSEESSSSSSEESSTSTEGPILEDLSSSGENLRKDSVEVVAYYALDNFDLKNDAPNFAIYKNNEELTYALDISLNETAQSNFDNCYVLLLRDIPIAFSYFNSWKCTNMIFGIDYDGGTERESKVFLQIEVELEEEGTDDEKTLNHLIFIPKSEFGEKTDFSSYENNLQIIWIARNG